MLTQVVSPGPCPKQAFPPSLRYAPECSPSFSSSGKEPDSPGSMSRSESISQSEFLQGASFKNPFSLENETITPSPFSAH